MLHLTDYETERLLLLEQYRIVDTGSESQFEHIAQLAATLFAAPIAAVTLVDTERVWLKARVGLDACEIARDIGFCAHAITDDALLVVPDTMKDERFAQNPLVKSGPRIRFYAGHR